MLGYRDNMDPIFSFFKAEEITIVITLARQFSMAVKEGGGGQNH